jgi:hypothetical protein
VAAVRRRLGAFGVGAHAARWEGRTWLGLEGGLPMGAGSGRFELARDPAGAPRWALAIDAAAGRRWRAALRHAGGHRTYVAPLGFDSARAPLAAATLDEGRNDGRTQTRLDVRARLSRRAALTFAFGTRLDPAGLRRAFDRPVGTGTVGLEVSPGSGWSVAGAVGLESRGSPGPSAEAEAAERRGAAKLRAAWEGRRLRLRFDWSGRVDLSRDPSGESSRLRRARDLVAVRGRWRPSPSTWLGGGLARFDMASDVTASLYEERMAGVNPAVTVRGRGRRWHAAIGVARGPLELGAWLATEVDGGAAPERSAGLVVKLTAGRAAE